MRDLKLTVSTMTPTTTEEAIQLTQEEPNEEPNEFQSEPELAPKPSFFKKVVNFLFGWMF